MPTLVRPLLERALLLDKQYDFNDYSFNQIFSLVHKKPVIANFYITY